MKVLIAVDEQACVNPVVEFVRNHQWPAASELLVLHVVAPTMWGFPFCTDSKLDRVAFKLSPCSSQIPPVKRS
jgi:hypothetical protein